MHPLLPAAFGRCAVAVAIAAAMAGPALAQSTAAGIAGRVTDAAGTGLAGATVTIVHRESGSTTTTLTDSGGRYAARGLRVGGPYEVRVTHAGRTETRDDVFLGLAETAYLDLAFAAELATVVITGSSASRIDRSAMGAGTRIGARDLAALPSIAGNLQDFARLDPRLVQTDKARGEISAVGQNTRFNSITIDGVTINDTFGLEANNLPTIRQPIPIDAIQSVQVNLSNYDVTQQGYTGANINAVTRSGTNEFKGSVFYAFRNDDLSGKRFNRVTGAYFDPPSFEETTAGVLLGGPIVADRLFYFVAAENFDSSRTRPDFAPLGGAGTNVAISPEAIASAIGIASTRWGMNAGTAQVPDGVAAELKNILLRLDWNISDDHRANLRFTRSEQVEPFLSGFAANSLSLSSFWHNQRKDFETLVGQWYADWTPAFSTELRVSQRDYDSAPTQVNGTRLPQVGLRFTGAQGLPAGVDTGARDLMFGTERSRQFNVLRTETTDVYFAGHLSRGDHELKAGFDWSDNEIYNAFLQDVFGQYRFQCENSSATLTYSFGTVVCGTGATASPAALQAQAALENFERGRPSFYQVQLPQTGRTLEDGVAIWSHRNTGLFVQDTWRVSDRLNLMFGVRVDRQEMPVRPIFNAAAAAAPVPGSAATRVRASGGFGFDNTVTLDGSTLVQPRAGFNWSLGEREGGRAKLRGGLGLFQGAAANVWLSNPYTNTGRATAVRSCTSFTACQAAGVAFNPDPHTQSLPGGVPAANVDFLAPDLEQPSVWKANLAYERELPALPVVGQLTAGIEWLHTQTRRSLAYEHLNLGAPTATGPDGRQMFYGPEGYNRACWRADGQPITTGACATPTGHSRTRALSNPNFANVLLARPTSKGEGDALTLSLNSAVASGIGWGVAYTYTRAKEVSPLTSSVSNSNWLNRNIFNPNEEVLQNSNYLVRDRFGANLVLSRAWLGGLRTTIGVFYEGRRGKPYGWTFLNDLNGDGVSGNDLMFVPSAPGSGEVEFVGGAAEEARFWAIVDAEPALGRARGGVAGRNDQFAPWVHNFDVRISQELPALFSASHRASVTLDILNFGNLLNRRWGRIDEIGFPSNRSFVNYAGLNASGRYIYSLGSLEDFVTRQSAGESQWAMQVTLRYEF